MQVLGVIFNCLSLHERMRARAVCKAWRTDMTGAGGFDCVELGHYLAGFTSKLSPVCAYLCHVVIDASCVLFPVPPLDVLVSLRTQLAPHVRVLSFSCCGWLTTGYLLQFIGVRPTVLYLGMRPFRGRFGVLCVL
jgi:hypothetical protein